MKTFAAIDVGTNSFHLIVVKIKSNGNFDVIDQTKEVVRLGEGSGGDIKHISDDAIIRGLAAMKTFKSIADLHNAEIRAVATSAVREAKNGKDFVETVAKEVAINIEVINGFEEARLIYLGVLKAVPAYGSKVLAFDIGGGSTEFVVGLKGEIKYSMSLKLGAVRLTQKYFQNRVIDSENILECRKWAEGIVYPVVKEIDKYDIQKVVASSGTAMAIALMIYEKNNPAKPIPLVLNNFEVTDKQLFELEKVILSKQNVKSLKEIPGLESKRAEIISAGVIIFTAIIRLTKVKAFSISAMSLREGIVIDSMQKIANRKSVPELKNIRSESVKHLSKKCNYDRTHCNHSAIISCKIFDDLQQLHGLTAEHREYLEYAAILHDIGYHIAHSQHHVHSLYIIKNSELLGFNEKEISIIANVARYHRKSLPKETHTDFAEMDINSKNIINILSAILRIGDSMDRTHTQRIYDVKAEIDGDVIRIKLKIKNSIPEIELWSLERRKSLFEKVFKKKIVVEY